MNDDYHRLTPTDSSAAWHYFSQWTDGSGKTTTLYAALTDLNDNTRNILTAEDPIEYQLEGLARLVNTKVDMTFARSLCAMSASLTLMW